MTHGFSSTDKSKKPMNMFYDFSTGKIYAYDSNEELQEIQIGGGGTMKCAMFGTLSGSGVKTVDISQLNLTSAEDYMVILSGDSTYLAGSGVSMYLSAKTSTSFSVTMVGSTSEISYQVITFK